MILLGLLVMGTMRSWRPILTKILGGIMFLPLLVKKYIYIFPDDWDNKKWKKECVIPKDNITFKEETWFNFVIPAEASEFFF